MTESSSKSLEQLQDEVREAQAALDAAELAAEAARMAEYNERQGRKVAAALDMDEAEFAAPAGAGGVAPYILPLSEKMNPSDPATAEFGQDWMAGSAAYIMSKPERTRPTRVFISSGLLDAGRWGIGAEWECRHDQTNAKLGDYTVVGIAIYGTDGALVRTVGEVPDRKLSAAVFK